MQFFKNNKSSIGVIVIVGLLIYVYFSYFRSSTEQLISSTPTSDSTSKLLVALASLHTITLDNSIFTDPVFLSLSDFGIQIDPQNVGRRNPFAPPQSN
jgi:hypothetical protein